MWLWLKPTKGSAPGTERPTPKTLTEVERLIVDVAFLRRRLAQPLETESTELGKQEPRKSSEKDSDERVHAIATDGLG